MIHDITISSIIFLAFFDTVVGYKSKTATIAPPIARKNALVCWIKKTQYIPRQNCNKLKPIFLSLSVHILQKL